MHLLPIAVDAVVDLAHRNPRLRARWRSLRTRQTDIVHVRFGSPDDRTGRRHVHGIAIDLEAEHGLWLTVDRDTEPLTLTVGGHLDAATVQTFRDGLDICLAEKQPGASLALDLSSLRFMGAVGLRAVFEAAQRIADRGELLLVNPPSVISRLLAPVALTNGLDLIAADEAVAHMALRPAPPERAAS